jgi:hypothetical protein
MKFNEKGLKRLVNELGMQHEMQRLIDAGLSYSSLAGVFDSIVSPYSETKVDIVAKKLFDAEISNPMYLSSEEERLQKYQTSDPRYFKERMKKLDLARKRKADKQCERRYQTFAEYFGINISEDHKNRRAIARLRGVSGQTAINDTTVRLRCISKTLLGRIKRETYFRALEEVLKN